MISKEGISLRDLFAIEILGGLLSNSGGVMQANPMSGAGWCNITPEEVVNLAYHLADLMLVEREVGLDATK